MPSPPIHRLLLGHATEYPTVTHSPTIRRLLLGRVIEYPAPTPHPPPVRKPFVDPPIKYPTVTPKPPTVTSKPPTIQRQFLPRKAVTNIPPIYVPSSHIIKPRPRIRKVGFVTSLVRKVKLPSPRITRYTALPEFKLLEGLSGVPDIRKVEARWGADENAMKVRKVWGTAFDPFSEDLPFDPEAPVKMPPPDIQIGGVVALRGKLMELGKSVASMGCLSVEGHRIERPDVKTTYVDTHCHLATTLRTLKDGTGDLTIPKSALDKFVKTIFPPQVSAVVDIHCDLPLNDSYEKAAALNWPDHFKYYFSVGVHPRCAMSYTDEVHESIINAMYHPSCVAWGECGIDYYKTPDSTHATQRAVFARQLTAAVALGKPIVIHTREADKDTLAAIQENVPKDHRLHFHCFTSGPALAKTILKEYPNAYIGLTGVISYSRIDHVNELIRSKDLPAERILLETDSPYMVPKKTYEWLVNVRPLDRKKRFLISHSGMIPFTAQKVVTEINKGMRERGEEKEITLDELLDITRNNAAKMYDIDV